MMPNSGYIAHLQLSWADGLAAGKYQASDLSDDDAVRAQRNRSPKAEHDWRVSRALLHACRLRGGFACAESLSHSGGHAALAQAPRAWGVGVDMEKVKPRQVFALADWACTPNEIVNLRNQPDEDSRLRFFYTLWTIKESFIKAANLDFPADLRRYGLDSGTDQGLTLRAPSGAWQARSYQLGADWIASVVWHPDGDVGAPEPQWRAGPASTLPAVTLIGSWPYHSARHAN